MTRALKWTLSGTLLLAVLWPTTARAQTLETPPANAAAPAASVASEGGGGFADAGRLTVAVERLFGYSYSRNSGLGRTVHASSITLLGNGLGNAFDSYTWPRLGFDYFVLNGISVGGSASYFRGTESGGSSTGFEVAPRVGYAYMLGANLGVWGRAGVTYVYESTSATAKFLAITIEAPIVYLPNPHVAFMVSPALDLGVYGNPDVKRTDIGVSFGIAVPF